MERVILHVDMDAYFASVEQQINPSLRGRPVLVCGNPLTKTVVASASYEAKRQGVRSGMSIPEALKLCPDAILVPGNPICYAETSRVVFSLLSLFTDTLEIYSIDEAFLDVSRTFPLFGGKGALGRRIKETIRKKTGLTCSVGMAPNKLLAKIAASLVKPDGLRIIEEKEVPELMSDLPVEEVPGIGPRLASLLSDWGITTCGQLQRLGENFLITRFGLRGRFLYQAACGFDNSPVVPTPPQPKSIGHSYTLPFNTDHTDFLRSVLFRLAEQVAARMRQSSFHGRVVTVCLRLDDFTTFTRQRKFAS
ncbi:MAG TPA: DNA polymerase IV, partial [bacterium]|nr:DNA polymerase IV [bacterium]